MEAAGVARNSSRSRSSIAGSMDENPNGLDPPEQPQGDVERDHGQIAELGSAPAADCQHPGGGLERREQADEQDVVGHDDGVPCVGHQAKCAGPANPA
jgi:hypothetical protein